MFIKMVNYFKGVVKVGISTSQCERVLNVLHKQGVDFWQVNRENEQVVIFKIYEKDLSLLYSNCNRYHAEVRVFDRLSIGHLFQKYRRRWGILLGLVAVIALFGSLGCFIWDVKVEGCDIKTTPTEIVRQFDELGLGIGKNRFKINASEIENKFLLNNDDVFWVSVNMRFTTAYIELKEKTGKRMEIYDFTGACDIFAERDGRIISMITTSGTPLVKVGDSVCAGDKLVSREYVDRYGKSIIVHSIATIKARTQRDIVASVPLTAIIHTPTGKSRSFLSLNIFNLKIPLYFKEKISYNNYDITQSRKVLKIGSFAFPISLERSTYTEVEISDIDLEYEGVKLEALSELLRQEKEQLFETEIINKTIKEETVDGNLTLTAHYDCIEDIAYAVGD